MLVVQLLPLLMAGLLSPCNFVCCGVIVSSGAQWLVSVVFYLISVLVIGSVLFSYVFVCVFHPCLFVSVLCLVFLLV